MKGKWIYFTVASLLGILTSFINGSIFITLFFLLIFLYKIKKFSKRQLAAIGFIFIIFFVRSENLERRTNFSRLSLDETNFVVYLQENLKVDGDSFTAAAKELRHNERLVLTYKIKTVQEKSEIQKRLKTGMACSVKGSLDEPFSSTNQNAFDYKEYLYRNHTYWILKADTLIPSKCMPQKKNPISFFQILRENGIEYIHNYFPKETAPLAIALLFGDRNYIEEDVLTAYQKLGIVHLLAISGLHVGMLVGMIYFLGIRAGISKEKMTSALLIFLPCYAIITGASPSVIRAVFMMIIFLALQKWGRNFSLLTIDVIGIVFILYTFISPYIIYNVGFQLSFGVSLSLILSAPIILKRFSNPISLLFATSFICQLAAAPIMFYYFFEVSFISVLANILFVPLFSLFILPAIFTIFLLHLLFGGNINFLVDFLNTIIYWMDIIAGRLAQLPFSTLTLGRPNFIILLLYMIIFPCSFSLWERMRGIKKSLTILILPVLILFLHGSINLLSPYGEITFIDVGQGDCIFIRLPYGKGNYLIDTGGNLRFNKEEWKLKKNQYEVGKDVVVPYLKSKGIITIHRLILTHGDTDHIGGAAAVIEEMKVKNIILPKSEELSELERVILLKAKNNKIPYYFTKAGDSWTVGQFKFQVLSPQQGMESERNNGSIVLFTKIGGLTWLFTGDLEESGEEKLISRYHNLDIDVLKVGHHGSKSSTSSSFLNRLEPRLAIISAGRNNRYGHPNKEVLNRLDERTIKVLRTDLNGAVTYYFKGDLGTFSTQMP
ncbi:DNA internalization-related competence protein ComEC/Rec2 [Bacillus sp. DTU_2020_1000418_1_SI_GHA_SEK_038]|uniref:DNA internalization-related competence protein ComEC/Rec2 n=1 Tax=Bacillus sp. DTU_2020_1000418_1_SI_GHA_SEK_038 TaxID=3077585 RepID=UPI0028E8E71D|nr:DNA internalization-related competence protein ComEC/Rec2 [Bacillus sp. DTU_2020_1000418_1_SI_GHA_SEK_038]WNS74364.1 DNA internalization-related competence protein ComEC/Rec2 [Bacillus sp. DTU_2020_1000418_1_SI_GHA_SEK_038]